MLVENYLEPTLYWYHLIANDYTLNTCCAPFSLLNILRQTDHEENSSFLFA